MKIGIANNSYKIIKKYDNLYTAMNFDNQPDDLRIPPSLPDRLSVNVDNKSKRVNFEAQTYHNCRAVLDGILNATPNIGIINVSRADDGILRKMPVFLKYQGKFYPQLGFKIGTDYLKKNENLSVDKFVIDKNDEVILSLFLSKSNKALLYTPANKFNVINIVKILYQD